MITQNQLKYFSSLLNKKYRRQENKFIVEGERSVLDGLNSKYKCEAILITSEYFDKKDELMKSSLMKKNKFYRLKSKGFQKISDTKSPQGIAAVFHHPKLKIETLLPFNDSIIVLLDNISDPGNVGTILRNCDWFGIKTILLSNDVADYTNPKVLRSTIGSIFHIDIIEMSDLTDIEKLKTAGYEILCADITGKNIFSYKNEKKKIVVFSSEAHGPSKEILKYVDKKITIPKIGKAESLNVASASAVILAELTKSF
jgi:TrmH family RNA methyltransferase